MQAWWQFYTVVASAAATLLGLLFVAVSINAAKLVSEERHGSRRLAEQAFRSYLTTVFISLLALFPTLSLVDYGRAALAITTSSAILSVYHLRVIVTARSEARDVLPRMSRRFLTAVAGYGLLIVAESELAFFSMDARSTLAAGALVLLSSAALTSWDLLIGLAKT